MTTASSALVALSNELAATVERAGAGVVAVEGRGRLGSAGFYLRPNLVITADHTLESDDIEVVHAGGRTERAEIAGRDPSTDLALLRTTTAGTPLVAAPVDAVRVGTIALALARDDDGDLAASMGVIAAVAAGWRTWHGGDVDRFIRPDLSLYPRFSGAPLLDASGAVIGLLTGGLSRRQTLAVPTATIERVVTTLLERGGRIPRAYLGVQLQTIPAGVIVLGVEADSPAHRDGVFVGDVITAVEGTRVEDVGDVHARIGGAAIGRPLALEVVRGGATTTVNVTPGERPERAR
jgi:S1-C subfamily serine protease